MKENDIARQGGNTTMFEESNYRNTYEHDCNGSDRDELSDFEIAEERKILVEISSIRHLAPLLFNGKLASDSVYHL